MRTPSQSYGTSLAMGSHSVTCHPTQVNAPRLTPAMQAGTRLNYPAGMEGWVDLVDLIAPRPVVEPVTFRSPVRRQTAAPPRQPLFYHVKICLLSRLHAEWMRRLWSYTYGMYEFRLVLGGGGCVLWCSAAAPGGTGHSDVVCLLSLLSASIMRPVNGRFSHHRRRYDWLTSLVSPCFYRAMH